MSTFSLAPFRSLLEHTIACSALAPPTHCLDFLLLLADLLPAQWSGHAARGFLVAGQALAPGNTLLVFACCLLISCTSLLISRNSGGLLSLCTIRTTACLALVACSSLRPSRPLLELLVACFAGHSPISHTTQIIAWTACCLLNSCTIWTSACMSCCWPSSWAL